MLSLKVKSQEGLNSMKVISESNKHEARGKRGRGVAGKTPVFGILKGDGKVSVTIVKKM